MEQKLAKVIKLKQPNPVYSESLVLAQNLSQILTEAVRQHGARVTSQAVQGMLKDAQMQVNSERQNKKKVSNG